jgi:hypothetical protein
MRTILPHFEIPITFPWEKYIKSYTTLEQILNNNVASKGWRCLPVSSIFHTVTLEDASPPKFCIGYLFPQSELAMTVYMQYVQFRGAEVAQSA